MLVTAFACTVTNVSAKDLEPAVLEVLRAPIERQEARNAPAQASLQIENKPSRDYLLPALEIVAFDCLLNRFDHYFIGDDYDVSLKSLKRNLRSSWVLDSDPFEINPLGHPYQGSIYFNFARSAGFNFWEPFAYTFAGSAFWEIAG